MSIKLLQRVLSRVRGVDVLVVVFDEMLYVSLRLEKKLGGCLGVV